MGVRLEGQDRPGIPVHDMSEQNKPVEVYIARIPFGVNLFEEMPVLKDGEWEGLMFGTSPDRFPGLELNACKKYLIVEAE